MMKVEKLGIYRILESVEQPEDGEEIESNLFIGLEAAKEICEECEPGDLIDVPVGLNEFKRIGRSKPLSNTLFSEFERLNEALIWKNSQIKSARLSPAP